MPQTRLKWRKLACLLPLAVTAGIGMTSCSTNGTGHSGAAKNDGAKACAKYLAVSKKATGPLDPSKWDAAIQSGLYSTDWTLRKASEKAQSAIKDRELSAFVSEIEKVPTICSSLKAGS